MTEAATQTRYRVEGMDCAGCANKITNAVRKLPGVDDVSVSVTAGSMTVRHAGTPNLDAAVLRQVNGLGGYKATVQGVKGATPGSDAHTGQDHAELHGHEHGSASGPWWKSRKGQLTIASGAAVVFLFLVGELLEGVAASKARASIQGLTALVPTSALLEENGQTREVPAEALAVGSIILVRPGDRIAADGEIIDGSSAIDEAPFTGESVPKRKSKGDAVFAGTINADGVVRVRVTAAAADNTIARVVKLVEEAQESKAPTERFIDRFSTYYTPAVVAVGALVAVVPPLLFGQSWAEWVYKGLAILLIGCPCALVISTPAAIAASLSAGARRGLLLKGGAVLESIGGITAIALDKTGTLTEGRPKVTDVIVAGRSERDVLSMAAALETGSSHPLALAILAKAKADGVPVPPAAEAAAVGGKGVTGRVGGVDLFLGSPMAAGEKTPLSADHLAQIATFNDEGKSVSVLLAGGTLAGIIAMRDEPRADAKAGLDALKALGVEPVMLTGDNRRTAEAIGKTLGLPVRAELLPEDKQRIVREMQQSGKKVAKVGDGINDAPSLAAADVGIAMGAAPMLPWKRPMPPCCTAGSWTWPAWWSCPAAPWATSGRTSRSRSASRPCFW